ncbi:TPA: Arc family DNA-binding protein [Aeromonas veronii]
MSQPKPYPLRMSDEMRASLQESADRSGRSLNAEIVHRLQQSIDDSFTGELNGGPGSSRMIASVEITDPGIDKDDPRYNVTAIAKQIQEVREMMEKLAKEMLDNKR